MFVTISFCNFVQENSRTRNARGDPGLINPLGIYLHIRNRASIIVSFTTNRDLDFLHDP